MKILILSWRGPGHPRAGGAEIVTHEHAKAWIKAGHAVTLFTSSFPGAKAEESIDGVQVIRQGGEILSVQLKAWWWYNFVKKEDFDLVVDHFHGLPFFTPLYVRVAKMAVIQETARRVWFLNRLASPLKQIAGVLGYVLEPTFFKFYKQVPFVTGAQSIIPELTDFGIPEKNITVIHHGVVVVPPKEIKKNNKLTITFLGRLTEDKGIEDALTCFNLIAQQLDGQFWIIGEPEVPSYRQVLDQLVKKYRLTDKVIFWGFVDQAKKFELLSQSHVVINPSAREGWGLVVIEAAAMQTPTVGYNVTGLRDSILDQKTGILTTANTPEQLAEETVKLVQSPEALKKMSLEAKKWADQFSWSHSAQKSLDFIDEVVRNYR